MEPRNTPSPASPATCWQIADNFGRALAACPPELREAADPQVKAVIDGVEATERQLLATLENYGVKIIDTTDAKFDPNFHQAIAEVPGEGKPPGTIVNVVQTGYLIGDRLLRPAMVTVARKENGPQRASIPRRRCAQRYPAR